MSVLSRHWPNGVPATARVPQTTLPRNLEIAAERYPERPALVFYDALTRYAELWHQVRSLAGYLQQACSLERGERVLLFSQNCPQFVVAYHAIMLAGGVVVPVNAMCMAGEFEYLAQDSGARLAFAASEVFEQVRPCLDSGLLRGVLVHRYLDAIDPDTDLELPDDLQAAPAIPAHPRCTPWQDALDAGLEPQPLELHPDDLCLLPYTSGTTGKPKGCMHTHRTLLASAQGSALWRGLHAESVFLGVAPLFHLLGMQNGMNLPILLGATTLMLTRWNRRNAAQLIERYRVSVWSAPPSMVVDFFADPQVGERDLSSLALLSGGGAAMPEAVASMLRERFGLVYNEAYGLTETAAFLHANPLAHGKQQCLGMPTMGVDSRILDPQTLQELPPGEVGELVTHGAQLMLGYWNNPQADAEAFIELDGLRYFRTGDLACVDEDGYFFMKDRLKRMISVSGYKVWPAEVENALYAHPAIHEVCVIALPDNRQGELVKAVVVLRPEQRGHVSEAEIVSWARQAMAVYKAPRVIEFADTLPKSGAGKILWRELQDAQRAHAVAC